MNGLWQGWSEDEVFGSLDSDGCEVCELLQDEFVDGRLTYRMNILFRFGSGFGAAESYEHFISSVRETCSRFHGLFLDDYRLQRIPGGPEVHVICEATRNLWEEVYVSEFKLKLDGYVAADAFSDLVTDRLLAEL